MTNDELAAIERDETMNRDYIPLPGGWEIQTKGKGSTFRILDRNTGNRMPIPEDVLHGFLTKMAHDVRAAYRAKEAEVDRLDTERSTVAANFSNVLTNLQAIFDLNPALCDWDQFNPAHMVAELHSYLEDKEAECARMREALAFYADPAIYKPHPHGPAFDSRDLSFHARAALEAKHD